MLRRIIFVSALIGCTLAEAQIAPSGAPREQLNQYVRQLQLAPGDDSLRSKLIELALTIDPKPNPPEEAVYESGKGKFLGDNASSAAGFTAAAEAFAQATILAPWVPSYYFSQGLMLEKAQRWEAAIKAFQWYLLADPKASDRAEVVARIGNLREWTEKGTTGTVDKTEVDKQHAAVSTDAATGLRDAQQKAEYLKRQFDALTLRQIMMCNPGARINRDGSAGGCTDQEATGSNWGDMSGFLQVAGPRPKVTLEGSDQDTLKIDGRMWTLCLKTADYHLGDTDFRNTGTCPGTVRMVRVDLNSNWNGSPAIYTETCNTSGYDIRTGHVSNSDCRERSRIYFVYGP